MKQSTAALVTTQLKDAIMGGDYPEGTQLKQDDIAKAFGVSKIPIREALVHLEREGFVTSYPGRGVFVARLSHDDARELYLLRIACEPVLLEHSLRQANATMFAEADGYLTALQADDLDTAAWHAFDREFHSTLYRCAQLPRMQQLARSSHDNLARYFFVYETLGQDFHARSDAEHHELYRLAKAGNTGKAKTLLLEHLERSFAELSSALKAKRLAKERI